MFCLICKISILITYIVNIDVLLQVITLYVPIIGVGIIGMNIDIYLESRYTYDLRIIFVFFFFFYLDAMHKISINYLLI